MAMEMGPASDIGAFEADAPSLRPTHLLSSHRHSSVIKAFTEHALQRYLQPRATPAPLAQAHRDAATPDDRESRSGRRHSGRPTRSEAPARRVPGRIHVSG